MKNFLYSILHNPVFANLLMFMIIAGGFIGGYTMIRETFPNFSMDRIQVSVVYPGADPSEVEEGICLKLEEALEGIEGVKKVTTQATEGVGSALVECEDSADTDYIRNEVDTLVSGITNFPKDIENPVVRELKQRSDVMSVIVWGQLPESQLKEFARGLEDDIKNLPGVSQTNLSGTRDYEISIEISEERLRQYRLSFNDLSDAVTRSGFNMPAGTIRTRGEEIRIRMLGRKYRAKDYRNIPIIARADGTIITLGNLAEIKDSFDEDAVVYSLFNGKPAVSINLFKTESEDALTITNRVNKLINEKMAIMPKSIHISKVFVVSRLIMDRLNLLLNNGKIGLALVFLVLWLFLDLRLSFWVTMGIPISIAGALMIMALIGCSINMLSLFGLIMVLGLIVDDAIVVGESIYSHRKYGDTPETAAVRGTGDVAFPVIAAVLTTIVAFLPLFWIPGMIGKFIKQIPIPVIASLSISLLECLIILPVHLRHLPPTDHKIMRFNPMGRIRKKVSGGLDYVIQCIYGPFVDRILPWRYAVLCIAISILAIVGGMSKSGFIKFIFFPKTDSDFIRATIEMAPGTPIEKTRKTAVRVMAAWKKVENKFEPQLPPGAKLTSAIYSLIGSSIDWREKNNAPNKFEVTVDLLPSQDRNISAQALVEAWQKKTGEIPGAVSTKFKTFAGGPGGLPIEIDLQGDDHDELLAAADKTLEHLKTYKGVYDQQLDWRPGKREFIVKIKPEAYHHGFTLDDLAKHVHGGFYGREALRIQRGRDDIRVKIRYPEKFGRDSIEYFKRLRIKTKNGKHIPFTAVADLTMQEGPSIINRNHRKRVVKVSADVNQDIGNAEDIMRKVKSRFLPQLKQRYNISYSLEGQQKEMKDSMKSLIISFPLALFGIYLIIATIFRSYIQPAVIMTTIPFGLVGGIAGHWIFGKPISIMSMFGMVALAGIVVNDAIVLIEGVNSRLENGMPLYEALREGGKRRFRAIMLTTFTTFAGLMPLILERSFQAQFLIPMALSIAFGVLFATFVTLLLLPCLLAILNDLRRYSFAFWFGHMPSTEEVEPRAVAFFKRKL
jgi:multidrug efflux pump subunit AcrB